MLAHLLNLPLAPQGAAEWLTFGAAQFGGALALSALRYGLFAGGAFLILWVWLGKRLEHRRIQKRVAPVRQRRRERLWSLSTVVIFAVLALITGIAFAHGATQIYLDFGAHGWGYWILSAAILIVGHDAYFYWTHRAMHHPRLYRLFHRTHHRSVSPSPWAAYAFAPAEAVVEGAYLSLVVYLLPLHPAAILVFVVHQLTRNVLGHSGIELFPRGASHSRWLGWMTMTTHHDLHHSRVRGNYGLYFTWWDRWMGTEIADYKAVFDAVPRERTADPARTPADDAEAALAAPRS